MSITDLLNEMVNAVCKAETKNVTVSLEGETMRVRFPFDDLVVKACKEAAGRWNRENRSWDWSVFGAIRVAEVMEKFGTPLTKEIAADVRKVYGSRASFRAQVEERRAALFRAVAALPGFSDRLAAALVPGSPPLRPFQSVGVGFLEVSGMSGIIADEMGLGKTPQALGWLALHPELRPAVVVVPNPAVCQWEVMTKRWLGFRPLRLDKTSIDIEKHPGIILVPWSMIARLLPVLVRENPKALILDEGHYIKSVSTQRTKAVFQLAETPSIQSRVILTGTPMLNRPVELWPLLHVVHRGKFGGFNEFRNRYCGPRVQKFSGRHVTTYDGATNQNELASRLVEVTIRRTKVEVAPEIPAKSRVNVEVEADQRNLSPEDMLKLIDAQARGDKVGMFTVLSIMRRLCGMAKLKACIDWADDFLSSSEEKLVMFAFHKDVQSGLADALERYGLVKFCAGQSIDQRGEAQQKFQTDPAIRVAILSISSAREALDLTAASNLAFAERDWVPGIEFQCEDRIHRLTTTKPVTIYRLISDHIVDQAIHETIDRKAEVFRALFEGVEGGGWTEEKLSSSIAQKVLDFARAGY